MMMKKATSFWFGLASLLAGPISCALAAKSDKLASGGSVPLLAMACTAVAIAGICVVTFKKPSRAKGD
jgi:hypothetical protein